MKTNPRILCCITILVLSSLILSCTFDSTKGCLVVRNQSENENLIIDAVYVKAHEDSGYTLVWSGTINDSRSHFIDLFPGSYSCKVHITDRTSRYGSGYCDTGYNVYKRINAGTFINLIFDGTGIYFK